MHGEREATMGRRCLLPGGLESMTGTRQTWAPTAGLSLSWEVDFGQVTASLWASVFCKVQEVVQAE